MKNTYLYLIIAAVRIYVFYHRKKTNQNKFYISTDNTDAGNSGGSGNGGGGTPPNTNITTEIPPTPPASTTTNADEDRLYPVVTTEKCPYCGTPNAIVTRWYESGEADNRPVEIEVECGNKSCPGSYGGKIVTGSKSSKFAVER